jgi:phosphoribosylamine---glycine ligase
MQRSLKVLLVGGGGREHAMAWKIARSPLLGRLFAAPGNAGIAAMSEFAECVDIAADDVDQLLSFATRERIDLTIVGPEAPLTQGLADRFTAAGLTVFGPTAAAARIEGSKMYAKALMHRLGVPTAASRAFTDLGTARAHLKSLPGPYVVKADGLAAGKGVVIARELAEAEAAVADMLEGGAFGAAGRTVVIEEHLTGEEASFLAFTDGTTVVPMVGAQDHKRIHDGDRGPNTGGMGAYSPAPVLTDALAERVLSEVMRPVVKALAAEGHPFCGVLYAGLMIDGDQYKVLEFNARFGDPEAQPILVRLESDLLEICDAAARGRLSQVEVRWSPNAAVCVVLASAGYPARATKGDVITGIEDAEAYEGVTVFHAGTARQGDDIVTAGGRVLGVTATAPDIRAAIDLAYNACGRIRFSGMQFRRDIGARAAGRSGGA